MDSSPDLSLKLRRGSSDSRDSFYMPFKQGIDSDIEEVTAKKAEPEPPAEEAEATTSSSPPPIPSPSAFSSSEIEREEIFEPYQKPYQDQSEETYLLPFQQQHREPIIETYSEPHQEPYPEQLENIREYQKAHISEPYTEQLEDVREPQEFIFDKDLSPSISPEDLQELPPALQEEIDSQEAAECLEKEKQLSPQYSIEKDIKSEGKTETQEALDNLEASEKLLIEELQEQTKSVSSRQNSYEAQIEESEIIAQPEDDVDTSAAITIVPIKTKIQSSSNSSLSSSRNELLLEDLPEKSTDALRKQLSQEEYTKIKITIEREPSLEEYFKKQSSVEYQESLLEKEFQTYGQSTEDPQIEDTEQNVLEKQSSVEKKLKSQTSEDAENEEVAEINVIKQSSFEKQSSVEKQPSIEKPSSRQPSVEKPSSRQPSVEKPTSRQPSMEKPPSRQPSVEKPSSRQPSIEESKDNISEKEYPTEQGIEESKDLQISWQETVEERLEKQQEQLQKQSSLDKRLDLNKQSSLEKETEKKPPLEDTKKQISIEEEKLQQDEDKAHIVQEQEEKPPTPPPPFSLTPPAHIRNIADLPTKNFDSDSIDSINAIDCKMDYDNRDDSTPSESLQRTPPPLPPLSLEKSGIMETASEQLVPSPSSPNNAIVSPETFSHHSSPGKSPRITYAQHVTIDETKTCSLHSSTHQLIQQSRRSTPSSPPPPFHSGPMTPTTSGLSRDSMGPGMYSDTQQLILSRKSPPAQIIETPLKTSSPTQHLAILYQTQQVQPILSPTRRLSRLPDQSRFLKQQQALAEHEIKPGEHFSTTLSALYGKILVVMGIAFPMAEVISTYIPPSFYEVFYLYLYTGSMIFLLFMYFTLLWRSKSPSPVITSHKSPARVMNSSSSDSGDVSEREDTESSDKSIRKSSKTIVPIRRPSVLASSAASRTEHFGSFYLRMGAVVFGIGSMIYSGLEVGQYFEIEKDSKCHNYLLAITPATRITFIFIQMYFIFFLNNERINVYRHKLLAKFGLMHVIGTNLAVWFSVLIQETKHEILTFYDPENRTLKISHRLGNKIHVHPIDGISQLISHSRVPRGLKGPHNIFECRRTNILGTLVQDASPFLFPCTIEYSLICAAILYVMWRKMTRPQTEPPARLEGLHPYKRSPHHYSVDCARAQKGLFIGILILVLTIISLILFFVLISRQEFVNVAVFEVNVCECILYASTTLATLIGIIQVRPLQYDATRRFTLDDILLVGSQSGSFLYSTFTIIGAHLTLRHNTVLVLITALMSLIETACQTMFILDASRRSAGSPEQVRKKPGREIVTFLLVSNLAMWAINTLEKSRAESHPIQLHFYGLWAWTIITHVSMPLAIFYRFHSTVCLCEIWKRAYKMKPAYM